MRVDLYVENLIVLIEKYTVVRFFEALKCLQTVTFVIASYNPYLFSTEINASLGIYGEGSDRPNWYRERLPPPNSQQSQQPHYPQQPILDPRIYTAIIEYMGRHIEVAGVKSLGHFKPVRCTIMGEHHGIPNLEYRKNHNYVTRAVIRDDIICVVYLEPNGQLLGAKAPPTGPPPRGAAGNLDLLWNN